MNKKIVIIGGGISGLATLHYLKQKYLERDDVEITLFEKNDYLGGTIRTLQINGAFVETGPNGFLNSRKRILELVKELNLSDALMEADEQSKIRYILKNQKLQEIPTSLSKFITSSILNPFEKLRILCEVFVPKYSGTSESVYDFGKRRLGKAFADRFLDPMVSGIHGGNANELHLKSAFPRMYDLEQNYGSLFKAMLSLRKAGGQATGMPKGHLMSFQKGMQQLIDSLVENCKSNIKFSTEIKTVSHNKERYVIYTEDQQYEADEVYCSAPAYAAAKLFKSLDIKFSKDLEKIEYAPIAVVSLMYDINDFKNPPQGFGFLIPSMEKKELLGVLFDSNIFPERSSKNQFLCRAMIGGARNPKAVLKSEDELVSLVESELEGLFQAAVKPKWSKVILWPKAIPQYTKSYVDIQKRIEESLKEHQNLHIVANYWRGIALTDCVENAYQTAIKSAQ